MWLDTEKFRELGSAICKGERKSLSRYMRELFHPENQFSLKMTACPTCHKPLVGKMLPDLEYFVQACPDRHGAWMSPEVSAKVREMVSRQFFISTRRWESLKLAAKCLFAGFAIVFLLNLSQMSAKNKIPQSEAEEAPAAQNILPAFSAESSNLPSAEEKRYVTNLLALLEEGAANRVEMNLRFKAPHSVQEGEKVFTDYLKKQRALISRMHAAEVPAALNEFHQKLIRAAEAQVVFFAEWAQRETSQNFENMLRHPALQACHREIVDAANLFGQIYPDIDTPTLLALEKRLSWFDII